MKGGREREREKVTGSNRVDGGVEEGAWDGVLLVCEVGDLEAN